MKTKKISKKLVLNKSTMVNLNDEQANIKGGTVISKFLTWCCIPQTGNTCYPDYTCPCYTIPHTDCAIQCEP